MLVGIVLGRCSLSVVWRDKTLLFFPLTSFAITLLILLQFYVSVGPDKIQLILNTRVNQAGVQYINWGWYIALIVAYFVIHFISTFFSVAMLGAAKLSMEGQDTQFRDGLSVATRSIHWVVLWTLLSATVGIALRLADLERRASEFMRVRFGASWPLLTYFVLPIVALERVSVPAAMARSVTLMEETWGTNLRPRFSFGSFLLVLNVPVVCLVAYGWLGGAGLHSLLVQAMIFYVAFTFILSQAARSILTVALHCYATSGEVPPGFTADFLQGAFESLPGTEAPVTPETDAPVKEAGN
jgi:hypothetical protein